MSITAGFAAVHLDPSAPLDEVVADVLGGKIKPRLDLEIPRWWHAIATVCAPGDEVPSPDFDTDPTNPVLGGFLFRDDDNDGDDDVPAPRIMVPAVVAFACRRLQERSDDERFERFDPARFEATLVYPGCWELADRDTVWASQILPALEDLRQFYRDASRADLAIVIEFF